MIRVRTNKLHKSPLAQYEYNSKLIKQTQSIKVTVDRYKKNLRCIHSQGQRTWLTWSPWKTFLIQIQAAEFFFIKVYNTNREGYFGDFRRSKPQERQRNILLRVQSCKAQQCRQLSSSCSKWPFKVDWAVFIKYDQQIFGDIWDLCCIDTMLGAHSKRITRRMSITNILV